MGNFYVLAYKCCDVMPSIFHVNVKTFGLAKFCSFKRLSVFVTYSCSNELFVVKIQLKKLGKLADNIIDEERRWLLWIPTWTPQDAC